MSRKLRFDWLAAGLLLLGMTGAGAGAGTALAQDADEAAGSAETLVVGTKVAPPFVMKNAQGEFTGISIALWEAVAEDLGLDFEYRETSLDGLFTGLEDGSLDVSVAALTVTAEREARIDFTYPFFTTGLAIAVPLEGSAVWTTVKRFFSWQFFTALLALTAVLLAAGAGIWVFERHRNPEEFGGSTAKGLGDGFWWAAVTMTTVGYGDKSPKTLGGRIIGLVWMFTAIIVVSSFTAAIATSLTVGQLGSNIRGVQDLAHVKAASVADSASAAVLTDRGIGFATYPELGKALEALENERLDAVIFDAPLLRYRVLEAHGNTLQVLKATFERQDYGFGVPQGSTLREPVNRAILRHLDTPAWQDVLTRYLGADR